MGNLQCPGNPEHEGVKILYMSDASPHYAVIRCVCDLWIKWGSKDAIKALRALLGGGTLKDAEAKDLHRGLICLEQAGDLNGARGLYAARLKHEEPLHNPESRTQDKGQTFTEHEREQIREIVRDELKKARE